MSFPFPWLLPCGRYSCYYQCWKMVWYSKGMGKKEPQTTTCCPFTPSFGDCSIGAEVCEKMLYCTAILLSCFTWGKWGFTLPLSDSVPHFGLHTGKEATLLASKATTQLYAVVTQTMDINLKIWGRERWNTIVLGICNLLFIGSGYLLRLEVNLIGGDLLGSSGHLVLISSQEKWEIPINSERVWVLEFSISCLRTIVLASHFCLSFRAGFQLQHPLLEGSGVDGWVGFSFFFFFSFLLGGGLVWLSLVVACFVSFLARSILAARTWKDWRMPPVFPRGLDFCILSWAEVIPHSLVNQ